MDRDPKTPVRSDSQCLTKSLNYLTDFNMWPYDRVSLPRYMYRVQHENSTTRFQANIGRLGPIDFTNAFETPGRYEFTIRLHDLLADLTHERVMRHLHWYDTQSEKSSFVSMFDSGKKAIERAKLHYHHNNEVYEQRRITVSKIITSEFVPALFKLNQIDGEIDGEFDEEIDVPIWVKMHSNCRCRANPFDYMNIKLDHVEELWISISEVSESLQIPNGKGQDDEWLAYYCIPWTRIHTVFPYDGNILHRTPGDSPVVSDGAHFDWASGAWYDPILEEEWKVFQKWMRDNKVMARAKERAEMELKAGRKPGLVKSSANDADDIVEAIEKLDLNDQSTVLWFPQSKRARKLRSQIGVSYRPGTRFSEQ